LQKYALEAEKKAKNTIIAVAVNPTNIVFKTTGTMVKKLSAFKPIRTLLIRIIIGTIKPSKIGTEQNVIANNAFLKSRLLGEILLNLFEVSLYFWLDLAVLSNISKITINMNVTTAIWDAADMLFIPIQTLNIPSVSV
jgi:hypothetical protein